MISDFTKRRPLSRAAFLFLHTPVSAILPRALLGAKTAFIATLPPLKTKNGHMSHTEKHILPEARPKNFRKIY